MRVNSATLCNDNSLLRPFHCARRSVCCCYGGCVTNNTGRPGRPRQKLPTEEEREFSSVFYICIAFLGCSGWLLLCESNRNRKGKTPNLCGMDEIEIELVVRRYARWEEMLGARRVFVQLWARDRENTCTWSCPNIIESYAKWIYCSVRESLNPLFPVPIRRRRATNSFEAYVVMHCAPVDLVLRNRLLALAARVEFITLQSRTNWEIIHLRIVGVACLLLVVAWMEWVLMLIWNEHSCTPFAVNAVCKWKVTDNESIWVVATIRSVENIHLLVIRHSKVKLKSFERARNKVSHSCTKVLLVNLV